MLRLRSKDKFVSDVALKGAENIGTTAERLVLLVEY
jgi:hypothetical protein